MRRAISAHKIATGRLLESIPCHVKNLKFWGKIGGCCLGGFSSVGIGMGAEDCCTRGSKEHCVRYGRLSIPVAESNGELTWSRTLFHEPC